MKIIMLSMSIGCLCSCGFVNPDSRGHFTMIADERGMEAFSRMQNGIITNVKAKNNAKSAYWQHQEAKETNETQRTPGFWDRKIPKDVQFED